jgi:zinc D-Ala-D-Ala carboxypeptidase
MDGGRWKYILWTGTGIRDVQQTPNVTKYLQDLNLIHRQLGIDPNDPSGRRGPIYVENLEVAGAGVDMYGRDLYLEKETAEAWAKMRSAAIEDGVSLVAVSGFRSVRRQQEIIQGKLTSGRLLVDILKANALPGYSQHHTGCAMDLTDDSGEEPLTEAFETRYAFDWLSRYATRFRFSLQYPRENPYGFIYEPWHWAHDNVHAFLIPRGTVTPGG